MNRGKAWKNFAYRALLIEKTLNWSVVVSEASAAFPQHFHHRLNKPLCVHCLWFKSFERLLSKNSPSACRQTPHDLWSLVGDSNGFFIKKQTCFVSYYSLFIALYTNPSQCSSTPFLWESNLLPVGGTVVTQNSGGPSLTMLSHVATRKNITAMFGFGFMSKPLWWRSGFPVCFWRESIQSYCEQQKCLWVRSCCGPAWSEPQPQDRGRTSIFSSSLSCHEKHAD